MHPATPRGHCASRITSSSRRRSPPEAELYRACGSCAATAALRDQWPTWGQEVQLAVLESPYRSLLEPLLAYIERLRREDPSSYITVILPEFVPRRLWQHLLHNQHALLIKGALLFKPNVVVTSVPFHLGRRAAVAPV